MREELWPALLCLTLGVRSILILLDHSFLRRWGDIQPVWGFPSLFSIYCWPWRPRNNCDKAFPPAPVLCLLPLPSLHLSHLFGLSQTVKIKLPNLKLTFLSELVLGRSQMCLQGLRSPCGFSSELPGQALQSIGILLEQPSLNIGIFCADKLQEVIPGLKGRKNNDCDK